MWNGKTSREKKMNFCTASERKWDVVRGKNHRIIWGSIESHKFYVADGKTPKKARQYQIESHSAYLASLSLPLRFDASLHIHTQNEISISAIASELKILSIEEKNRARKKVHSFFIFRIRFSFVSDATWMSVRESGKHEFFTDYKRGSQQKSCKQLRVQIGVHLRAQTNSSHIFLTIKSHLFLFSSIVKKHHKNHYHQHS